MLRTFVLLSLLFSTHMARSSESPLEPFRWEQRIILVSAPQAESESLLARLKAAEAEINERDIHWFVFTTESSATNYQSGLPADFRADVMGRYFKDAGGATQVRLIGKDGGVKLREETLNIDRIFALIDTMPMRQAEMRRKDRISSVDMKMLFDFSDTGKAPAWRSNNDGVMGGLSQGSAEVSKDLMVFSGNLSLENNGGFSSVFQRLDQDLSAYDGIRLKVLGDGRTYQLRLQSDAMFRPGQPVNYGQEFSTEKDQWIEVFVPFSELRQSWRGLKLSGYRFNPSEIRRIAIMLADKQAGPFVLKVEWLAAEKRSAD